jgi:hypothetical protein
LAPVAVFILIWSTVDHLSAVVAALVGAGYLFLVQRRVATAVTVLLVVLLFNSALLPLAFKAGLSPSVVRSLSYWKEGIVLGSLLALWRRRPFRRPDALDIAALGFVALGTAYLLLPRLFIGSAGGSSLSFYDRALGWRSDVLYVMVFLVFRHLRLGRALVDQILRRVLVVVTATAVIGIFEALFSSTWNNFAVHVLGVTNYRHAVLHTQPSAVFHLNDVRTFAILQGHQILRIGSVLFDYIAIGFVFAVGLGIAAEIVARGRAPRWVYASLPVLGIALLLTQTRSAIVAGLVATAFALRRRAGKGLGDRSRLARILAVLLVAALPFVILTGLLQRFGSAPHSDTQHRSSLSTGINAMKLYPMGLGLGTAAGGGLIAFQANTNPTPDVVISESQYLQVGTQLGFIGLGLYLATVLLLIRRLLLRSHDDPLSLAPSAVSNVVIGASIGVIFTQAYVSVELAVLLWGLAGLAVSVVDDRLDQSTEPGATTMRPTSTT